MSSPLIAFQLLSLSSDNPIIKMKKIIGNDNPYEAKKIQPNTIRAKYGKNVIENCCYYSKTENKVEQDIQFVFSSEQVKEINLSPISINAPLNYPIKSTRTLCLIKPHILIDKKLGSLYSYLINKDITIQSLRFFNKSSIIPLKYLQLYKFLPQYNENIKIFSQYSSIFLQISILTQQDNENIIQKFKKICGPYDPTYGKKIQPDSIRAIFGKNRIENAIHCTQLQQDVNYEIQLVFRN